MSEEIQSSLLQRLLWFSAWCVALEIRVQCVPFGKQSTFWTLSGGWEELSCLWSNGCVALSENSYLSCMVLAVCHQ